jgi:hypothetical protein
MRFTRPHDGPKDRRYLQYAPSSYWLSPSVSTASYRRARRRFEVASCRHAVAVPRPLLNEPSSGSQAMSPAAAITGWRAAL